MTLKEARSIAAEFLDVPLAFESQEDLDELTEAISVLLDYTYEAPDND